MKPIVKIICCGAILIWAHSAIASEENAESISPSMAGAIKVYPVKKMDQAGVEKRLEDRAVRTKARTEQARKSKLTQDQRDASVTGQAVGPDDGQSAQGQ